MRDSVIMRLTARVRAMTLNVIRFRKAFLKRRIEKLQAEIKRLESL